MRYLGGDDGLEGGCLCSSFCLPVWCVATQSMMCWEQAAGGAGPDAGSKATVCWLRRHVCGHPGCQQSSTPRHERTAQRVQSATREQTQPRAPAGLQAHARPTLAQTLKTAFFRSAGVGTLASNEPLPPAPYVTSSATEAPSAAQPALGVLPALFRTTA